METTGQMNRQEAAMQRLIDGYLKRQSTTVLKASANGPHLDTDSLAAFAEQRLSESEVRPVVRHLVDCSFCRHVTAELIRLDLAFNEEPSPSRPANLAEPSKISAVLEGLLSRIFGTQDGAVFAHHEEGQDSDPDEKKEPGKID